MRNLVSTLFFGNIFYGFCALALCVETNFQHGLSANGPHFYFLVFSGTIVFYSRIYYKSRHSKYPDDRTLWYYKYRQLIKVVYTALLLLITVDVIILLLRQHTSPTSLPPLHWGLLLAIPLVAFLYSFKALPFSRITQLRTIGWLKPFFIGFAWAGLVTVYPLLFRQMQSGIGAADIQLPSFTYWVQNFLFISVLAIIFDIKDYKADKRHNLNTIPAIMGIRKTLFVLIIPLSLLSAGMLFLHGFYQHTGLLSLLVQLLPYGLLWYLLTRLHKQPGLLFYLFAIDGLMLAKGIFGIISTSV